VTAAVIQGIPHVEGLVSFFLVRRLVVSTVSPGRSSSFSRFAVASGIAKDQSGVYPGGSRTVVVALHRGTGRWIVVAYGVRRVGCRSPQAFFGGRRASILRDLGIRCG